MISRRLFYKISIVTLSALLLIAFNSQIAIATTAREVDTNQDGVINFSDFISLVSVWGHTIEEDSFYSFYDWDKSGRIDFGDFLIFASFYGQSYLSLPTLSLSGLSDTLTVGQMDTLVISIAKNSIPPGCDVFAIGIGGINFEPTDTRFGVDSITFTSRVTLKEPGDFVVTVEAQLCGPSRQDSVNVVGISPP